MNKAVERTLNVCGMILLITGLAKIISSQGSARVLGEADSIFVLPYSKLMLWIGILETIVAGVCFFRGVNLAKRVFLLVWITTVFFFYRLGLWWLSAETPCMCLGSLADSLKLTPRTASILTNVAFAILAIGSSFTAFIVTTGRDMRTSRQSGEPEACLRDDT